MIYKINLIKNKILKLMTSFSRHLGALLLSDCLALLVVLVLGHLTWHLLAVLPGHLGAGSLGLLALNLVLDSLARLLGDRDTNISLDIMALLFRYGILYLGQKRISKFSNQ